MRKALGEFLRPEFLGRVDEIVVFHALTKENYERIAALRLEELRGPLQEKSIVLTYDDAALKAVAEKSFGGKSGARDLVRVIRKEVEDRICTMLVEHADQKLESVLVSAQDGVLNVTGTEVPRELPRPLLRPLRRKSRRKLLRRPFCRPRRNPYRKRRMRRIPEPRKTGRSGKEQSDDGMTAQKRPFPSAAGFQVYKRIKRRLCTQRQGRLFDEII